MAVPKYLYRIHKGIFVILSFYFPSTVYCQNIQITGYVMGGNPLVGIPGVYILCESKMECATITDSTGKFIINIPENQNYLFFKHQSFEEKIIKGPFKQSVLNKAIIMEEKIMELMPVEIQAFKLLSVNDIHYESEIISYKDIKSGSITQTVDAFNKIPEISVQKTQAGGGSPILRGLDANKILLYHDGVRMNNAIYRGGNIHNILMVDESALKRIDVIYGPTSPIYGSDALGGTIHLQTKEPVIGIINEKPNFFGNYYAKTTTTSNELSTHADLNIGWCNWALFSSITYKSFGDSKKGKIKNVGLGDVLYYPVTFVSGDTVYDRIENNTNRYVQKNSAYNQLSAIQKFKFKINNKLNYTAGIQYNTLDKVMRFDKIQLDIDSNSAKYAEWYYDPYSKLLITNNFELNNKTIAYDKVIVNLSYQKIDEGRVLRKYASPIRLKESERVDIYNLNFNFNKSSIGKKKHQLNYGAEIIHENIHSQGFEEQIVSFKQTRVSGRYPDGSVFQHGGVFSSMIINHSKKVIISTGARLSFSNLLAAFKNDMYNDFNDIFENINQKSIAPSANLGFLSKKNDIRFRLNLSTGFRSPNLDDLAKLGESAGYIFEIPNPEVSPEFISSSDFEINYNKTSDNFISSFSLTSYYSYLFNSIVKSSTTFKDSSFHFDGTDKYYYYHKTNSGQAYIYGSSFTFNLKNKTNGLCLKGGINYTKGIDISNDEPFTGIPPVKIVMGIKREGNVFNMGIDATYNSEKNPNQMSALELNDTRIPKGGTPSWIIYDLTTTWIINDKSRLNMSVENLFDINYRVFGSGINAPGRNVNIAYYFSF